MLYRQTDKQWKDDIMTGPKDFLHMFTKEKLQRWKINNDSIHGDTLGLFGCLVTASCSAHSICYDNKQKNPKKVNELLRIQKGYQSLFDISKCEPKGQKESHIVWTVLQQILDIKNIDYFWTGKIDIEHPKYFYICRVPYKPPKIMSGHYCLITSMKNDIIHYFDTDSGIIRTDWNTNLKDKNGNSIYFLHRIEFK